LLRVVGPETRARDERATSTNANAVELAPHFLLARREKCGDALAEPRLAAEVVERSLATTMT